MTDSRAQADPNPENAVLAALAGGVLAAIVLRLIRGREEGE